MSKSSLHSDENKALVAVLVAARKEAGFSQADVAEGMNKIQQFVSRIESGERRVDLLEFIMYARAIKADPRELLGRVLRKLPKTFDT